MSKSCNMSTEQNWKKRKMERKREEWSKTCRPRWAKNKERKEKRAEWSKTMQKMLEKK